jgi:FlaA1/EpsC-like NDP-sugar epimerase
MKGFPMKKKGPDRISPLLRRFFVGMLLAAALAVSPAAAFLLRFDFIIPGGEVNHLRTSIALAVTLKLVVLLMFRVHRGWWSLVGVADLQRVLAGSASASCLWAGALYLIHGPNFPRSVLLIDFMQTTSLILAALMTRRFLNEGLSGWRAKSQLKGVLIYGAGWAGCALTREIRAYPRLGYWALGFVDDDPSKRGEILSGVPVLGSGRDIPAIVRNLSRRRPAPAEILIALPSASSAEMRAAIAYCRKSGLPVRTLPSMGSLIQDRNLSRQVRDVSLEDLLCRESVTLEVDRIRECVEGKAVLVTGAAGSIGSELCRQICSFYPERLVLFDQAESDLFRTDLELRKLFPNTVILPLIGDVRSAARVQQAIRENTVALIFHAAAYKHVPLMEANAVEAAHANVLGTWNIFQAAQQCGVEKVVLISSDKAVNPSNVMGATKRAAELLSAAVESGAELSTQYAAVRFGNVLGSNGSVTPIFREQIAAGGPVTVTHPEIRRYFMTIREAVQLVLQAMTMSQGGEIFVLDMGEPVKIVDLARNMIRLSGFVPDVDIPIQFTGLRPGEKLFEELISEGEDILPTYHEKIKIFGGPKPPPHSVRRWIEDLRYFIDARDDLRVVLHLKDFVPEYEISAELRKHLGMRQDSASLKSRSAAV